MTSKTYSWPNGDGLNLRHLYQTPNGWRLDMFLVMLLGVLRFPNKSCEANEDEFYERKGYSLISEELYDRIMRRFDETLDLCYSCIEGQAPYREKDDSDSVFFITELMDPTTIAIMRPMKGKKYIKLAFNKNHIMFKKVAYWEGQQGLIKYAVNPMIWDIMVHAYQDLRKFLAEEAQSLNLHS